MNVWSPLFRHRAGGYAAHAFIAATALLVGKFAGANSGASTPASALPTSALSTSALSASALPTPALPTPALPTSALPTSALPTPALPTPTRTGAVPYVDPLFRYDLRVELPVVGVGLGAWIATEVLKPQLAPKTCRVCEYTPDGIDTRNGLDAGVARFLRWGNTDAANQLSNVTGFALIPVAMLGLGALANVQQGSFAQGLVDLLMVAEATVLAVDLNQLVKFSVGRQRPFVHGLPESEKLLVPDAADNNLFRSHDVVLCVGDGHRNRGDVALCSAGAARVGGGHPAGHPDRCLAHQRGSPLLHGCCDGGGDRLGDGFFGAVAASQTENVDGDLSAVDEPSNTERRGPGRHHGRSLVDGFALMRPKRDGHPARRGGRPKRARACRPVVSWCAARPRPSLGWAAVPTGR